MGLGVQFTISGLDEITTKLSSIKDKAEQFVRDEPMKLANEMVDKMKEQAPVDTGFLRDNISAEEGEEGKATVKSDADYSIYVEMGTRYMTAEPFFFTVFDEYTIQNIITDWNEQVDI